MYVEIDFGEAQGPLFSRLPIPRAGPLLIMFPDP